MSSPRSLRDARYKRSPKGKAASARYRRSAKGKAVVARYKHSAKGKATEIRYKRSAKGKAVVSRYRQSPKGKAARAQQWLSKGKAARARRRKEKQDAGRVLAHEPTTETASTGPDRRRQAVFVGDLSLSERCGHSRWGEASRLTLTGL